MFNSKYSYSFNNGLSFKDDSGKNPLLIAIGVRALVGGLVGGIDAIINKKDFINGFIQGAMIGAIMGGLIATGNGIAAYTVLIKSGAQALMTQGSVLNNFTEFSFENAVPSLVGIGGLFVGAKAFNMPTWVSNLFGYMGAILTIKDIQSTACDEDYATDFAKDNLCI